jgi:uncharacterized protein
MILFGSFNTNKFSQSSDIDLAIIAQDIELIKKRKQKVLNEISKLFDYREIDLILLNYADPLLKFNIANNGRLIYEKATGLFNIFKVRAMSENNDAQKFYQLDKKYINNYLMGEDDYGKQRVSPPQVK